MAPIVASKSQLLEWINEYFDLHYTKIEQCGNGTVYCLIFNALYPNTINIQRLNRNPTSEFQILNNYKLLQNGFNKAKISRDVNVEKLMKCRLQDNLEFLQWLGRLWCEMNSDFSFSSSGVNSLHTSKTPSRASTSRRSSSIHSTRRPSTASNSRSSSNSNPQLQAKPISTPAGSAPGATVTTKTTPLLSSQPHANPNLNPAMKSDSIYKHRTLEHTSKFESKSTSSEVAKLNKQVQLLQDSVDELTTLKDGLEIERNFYFNKLRDIEIICQNISQSDNAENVSTLALIGDLMDIMYTTEDGFLLPEDQNNTNIENLTTTPETNKTNLSISAANPNEPAGYTKLLDSSLDLTNTNLTSLDTNATNDEIFDDETF